MLIYPDFYLDSVLEITPEFCEKNKIRGLILDVDNTLIDIDKKMLDGAKDWHSSVTNAGVKTMIVSNTSHQEKASKVADELGIKYINFAKKPAKGGFLKAQKMMGLQENEIASVGDQIFTDVLGANRCKMKSILVKPVDPERDLWYTKWKRPIEAWIIKKYLKKMEGKTN
ncbi:MAG: YqeG family HAD IIIA-type phosphatase [Clostridia bacterium]|nr:YqeG family HAD IIIA-type phosphatase [Clostridia bacterium]